MNFSPESFGLGILAGLIILAIIWLIADRATLKAKLAALEAKAEPGIKKAIAAVEHDVHLVEAAPKVALNDIEALFAKGLADIRAEAAKVEATKAVPPAAPAAPVA